MTTLNIKPEFPVKFQDRLQVYNTGRESGRAIRRLKNQRNLRAFDVVLSKLSECEFLELRALLDQEGSSGVFTWTPPGEVTSIEVQLDGDSFSFRLSGIYYDVQLKLRQVVITN